MTKVPLSGTTIMTAALVILPATAGANDAISATGTTSDTTASGERVPAADPTGGAYTSPTLLFIPAGAMPAWNARATLLSEFQTPRPAIDAGIRPGVGLELGLPAGFAVAAGTNWVGGDVNDSGQKEFSLGLSPYVQGRFHIYGDRSGQDFQLGSAVTYKFVGFDGDPGEIELSFSGQVRKPRWEAGVQGVFGKDFATTDADVEVHAYALYRIIAQLGVGAAGQLRDGVVIQPGESTYDVAAGGLASLTLGRYQIGGLFGGTTLGLDQGRFGALGQLFASARF